MSSLLFMAEFSWPLLTSTVSTSSLRGTGRPCSSFRRANSGSLWGLL